MATKLEAAVADLKAAIVANNDDDGIEAVGLIIFCAFDVFERATVALERIAAHLAPSDTIQP